MAEENTVSRLAYWKRLFSNGSLSRCVHVQVTEYLSKSCPGSRVLDLACGDGFMLGTMRKLNFHTVGLDLAFNNGVYAYENGLVNFVVGNMWELPFKDQTFDAVTCLQALNYIERHEDAIAFVIEISRVAIHHVVVSFSPWHSSQCESGVDGLAILAMLEDDGWKAGIWGMGVSGTDAKMYTLTR
jgi:ubiquinone/menaquinone biosynthesis C-methylase UbiE